MKSKSKGPPRASILEIAREAKVSTATVSRAFNRPELLHAETLSRVQRIARQLGFRPNLVGRSLRRGSTQTIGVLLPTLTNPVFAECFEGACRYAQNIGYSIMVATTNYDHQGELESLHTLLDHQVDGLILTLGSYMPLANHDLLQKAQATPYILAYSMLPGIPSVTIDDFRASQHLAELLAAFNHRRMVFLSGPLRDSDRAARRLLGARACAERLGLDPVPHAVMPSHVECDPIQVEQLIRRQTLPIAVMCSNDLLALSLMSICRSLGLRIPQDVSVCGFDGIAPGAMYDPPLTSVVQPSMEIGQIACKKLLDHLTADHRLTSAIVPHRIFEGGTVCTLPPRPDKGAAAP
ncbi:LacI family DNA-binding transcriptional regulator [Bordetella pseudohinzii]|uniref:HTH-type transcriptional repressor CytR n=1 Tax=Bordetella pseudohinzii TaxID=1331258 RepID=A0A0J6CB56_9BORD|nr:LacI family DNA-binding transcriptional regulator [Bordetella pseudohinzii]ANY14491.1 LacI family transcriptional regulator [Bordetella pseudohinzii]KMM26672.1 LacI family transcriptional regulator [Bordetella pseudohinzii]KXA81026.1 LacI family transcriptional regulator [Bordetella pseudohinzii]CUI64255.1 HTH-type transcriptional repressor CytR [Bordetella pseudohinzii]